MVSRGEIWLVGLDPTVGSEIQKSRPGDLPARMNDHLRTVIVASLTTGSRAAGFRVPITFHDKQGLVLLDQIRTVDERRLVKRLGETSPGHLEKILSTLSAVFQS